MNKKIKELAFEAMSINQTVPDDSFYVDISKLKEFEKFAELILTDVISAIYRSDIGDKKQEKLILELGHKFGLDAQQVDKLVKPVYNSAFIQGSKYVYYK